MPSESEERQLKQLETARITRVGIGRLYNLGNYEHIRYDITIEIPPEADVLDSVSKLRQILRALKPLKAEGYAEKRARQLDALTDSEIVRGVEDGTFTGKSSTTTVSRHWPVALPSPVCWCQ